MSLSRWHTVLGLVAFLAIVPTAGAQQATARIGYVAPAGGRQGTTFLVMVGGRYLDGTTAVFVSGNGVQTKVIEYLRPIRQGQADVFRARLKTLMDKKSAAEAAEKSLLSGGSKTSVWTAADEMLAAAIKKKIVIALHGQPAPATGETVLVQITLAANAKPGNREIRLETPKGLSNPMLFCVGQIPEFSKEPRIADPSAQAKGSSRRDEPQILPPEPPVEITPPVVVNGQILPGGADRYRIQAHKGQRLVIVADARRLIPYISDAVPGWFQAALTLYDAKGHELAYADHYLFHPDPLLYHEVAEDGQYVVEIRDALYRGREDFVYRLIVGEIPLVTSIFPLGGRLGTRSTVEVRGWNLPSTPLTRENMDKEPGIYPFSVGQGEQVSNVVPFAVDTLPECLEQEPNNEPKTAQPLTLPVVVNGRIDAADDWDVFSFAGRGGAEIVAEVYARRLNSPLDSVIRLTDANGRQLAMNDDFEDKGAGLTTHQADSYLRATLPADGTYYLYLGDAQHQGGPEYAYRLRVGLARPDFDLRVVPSSVSVRGGGSVPLTVYALRKDGFSGEIALALKDAPDGFTLSAATVPANQDQVQLTLKVAPMTQEAPVRVNLEGVATIQGREVAHVAVPAENMMQAFEYRHLVPAEELDVAVSGRSTLRSSAKLLGKSPVKIPAGGTAKIRIGVSPRTLIGKFQVALRKPPAGIAIEKVSTSREGVEIVLQSDAAKVKPGLRGSLAIVAVPTQPADPGKAKQQAAQRTSLPTLPPVSFEIVAP
jgi:hypothetical protein